VANSLAAHSRKDIPLALFTDTEFEPQPRRRRSLFGWLILTLSVVGVTVVAAIPAPYVIEQPGPVYNVLGKESIGGKRVPMIQIPSQKTYPTSGSLDMLTVSIRGNPQELPSWLDVASAYFDPSQAVVPVESLFPSGVTIEDSNQQGKVDMANSKKEAIAAALGHLGYEFPRSLIVDDIAKKSPAEGVLVPGDVILSVNGESFPDVTGLRTRIAQNGITKPAVVVVLRDGVQQSVEITPVLSGAKKPTAIFGIVVGSEYAFPFEVDIQLENVGGPSAGMMFALGIIDRLTKGELNGGEQVAGTGTIDSTGDVGAIGGIRQKLYGARDAGATWFLAPQANCDEVAGHVPSGLTVVAVATLDDALAALDEISSGKDTSALPTCPAG
jgi:PDZ domain-containing protein